MTALTPNQLIRDRLANQQLTGSLLKTPAGVVTWMGAMQAQEFATARWAIGLRAPELDDAAVREAFDRGEILRTHALRGTWHFVAPADIRWVLALTGGRVRRAMGLQLRRTELDAATLKRTKTIIARVLRGGARLTREQIREALRKDGVAADGLRLVLVLMHAELEGLICSGPRVGKQFTYAWMADRVPAGPSLERDEALVRLAERFFRSRGPATAKDFAWWAGLTLRDVRAGIEGLGAGFSRTTLDGEEYVFPTGSTSNAGATATFLMPEYDEYGMSYRDRARFTAPCFPGTASDGAGQPRRYVVVVRGQLHGWWSRQPDGSAVVPPAYLRTLPTAARREVMAAHQRYTRFFGLK